MSSSHRRPQPRVRSALGACVAQSPIGPNPRFDSCANGTAFKTDGTTPIGKPVMSFSVAVPGMGGIGACCADYSDILASASQIKSAVSTLCNMSDTVRNMIPETIPLPIKLPGHHPPVGFPARQFFCPQAGVPPFVPPAADAGGAAALPPIADDF